MSEGMQSRNAIPEDEFWFLVRTQEDAFRLSDAGMGTAGLFLLRRSQEIAHAHSHGEPFHDALMFQWERVIDDFSGLFLYGPDPRRVSLLLN
jgi:hypothetical protein